MVLHGGVPSYDPTLVKSSSSLISLVDGALRSASSNRLVVQPVKLSTTSSRAFLVAVAQLWDSLPETSRWLIEIFPSQQSCPHVVL